jgi:molybdopterin-binding protein
MNEYRIGEAAAFLGVSADTVRRLANLGKLKTRRSAGGHRIIRGEDLAKFVSGGEAGRTQEYSRQSARNRFPGIVTRVLKDKVTAQVEMQAGIFRIVALMTREAADDLKLAPGSRAIAGVKATNVVIEVPSSGAGIQ